MQRFDYYIRGLVAVFDRYFFASQGMELIGRISLNCLIATLLSFSCQTLADSMDQELFGQALFFDTSLSLTRSQSCATCHETGRAFIDGRANDVAGAVSIGDDGHSIGDRNAPSVAYASQIPDFHQNDLGEYVGGFFLDGRSATLNAQGAEPFLNPLEMAMPDRESVVQRVRENPVYVDSMQSLYGDDIFEDEIRAFELIVESIVAFEKTELFSPFDSKYDRHLRGEYELTNAEELGRILFFSQMIGCHSCHLMDSRESTANEVFTNHKYHNIGVPVNQAVRDKNGVTEIDVGLLANPEVSDSLQAGKFRVPTLRNVAVTGPYMHNGVFQELETAILFYDKYLVVNQVSAENPETGEQWGDPEVDETIDLDLLQQGQPITAERARVLVAFLRTLTDRRYEPLLDR
jgi:cytochrome c peroxidase